MFAGLAWIFLADLSGRTLVRLQPLGPVRRSTLLAVKHALVENLGAQVTTVSQTAIPNSAWYGPRKRYRADRLLTYLAPMARGRGTTLGITRSDISTTKGSVRDWGVFGLGQMPGHAAVISSFRLGRNSDKLMALVAVHEVGHNLGLPHCPTPRCIMNDAEGSKRHLDEATSLCPSCRRKLGLTR